MPTFHSSHTKTLRYSRCCFSRESASSTHRDRLGSRTPLGLYRRIEGASTGLPQAKSTLDTHCIPKAILSSARKMHKRCVCVCVSVCAAVAVLAFAHGVRPLVVERIIVLKLVKLVPSEMRQA